MVPWVRVASPESWIRATPKSACTAGSTTGTTYMPLAPTVMSTSVTSSKPRPRHTM